MARITIPLGVTHTKTISLSVETNNGAIMKIGVTAANI